MACDSITPVTDQNRLAPGMDYRGYVTPEESFLVGATGNLVNDTACTAGPT